MQKTISEKSKVQYYDIGLLLGQLLQSKLDKTIIGIFGDIWRVKNFASNNILDNTKMLRNIEGEVGYSTNGWKVIDWMIQNNISADKVIIFTDCQMWDSTSYSYNINNDNKEFSKLWNTYKKDINPSCKLYLFDMTGHGNTPVTINSQGVYFVAGWSERIFEAIKSIEEGKNIIKKISKIEI